MDANFKKAEVALTERLDKLEWSQKNLSNAVQELANKAGVEKKEADASTTPPVAVTDTIWAGFDETSRRSFIASAFVDKCGAGREAPSTVVEQLVLAASRREVVEKISCAEVERKVVSSPPATTPAPAAGQAQASCQEPNVWSEVFGCVGQEIQGISNQ
jgi:hypothetical protein